MPPRRRVARAPLPEGLEREIVLVDDCSTDGRTPALCDQYASDRVTVVHLPHNHGRALVRNAGIALAQTVLTWELRRAGRHALRDLDAHLLDDIGLTAVDARIEADKPFWQD